MPFTDFIEAKILDHVFGGNTVGNQYTPAANLYLGLSSTPLGENGSGATEPSGNAYARAAIANTTASWSAAASSPTAKKNAVTVSFPQATGAGWGTLGYFFIADAATGGNVLCHGALSVAKTIAAGDIASFAVDDITITLE